MTIDKEKLQRAKAWCFDNGKTAEEMESAWNNALLAGNIVVGNLDRHGKKWWWLPEHLLSQLAERYSKAGAEHDD